MGYFARRVVYAEEECWTNSLDVRILMGNTRPTPLILFGCFSGWWSVRGDHPVDLILLSYMTTRSLFVVGTLMRIFIILVSSQRGHRPLLYYFFHVGINGL